MACFLPISHKCIIEFIGCDVFRSQCTHNKSVPFLSLDTILGPRQEMFDMGRYGLSSSPILYTDSCLNYIDFHPDYTKCCQRCRLEAPSFTEMLGGWVGGDGKEGGQKWPYMPQYSLAPRQKINETKAVFFLPNQSIYINTCKDCGQVQNILGVYII